MKLKSRNQVVFDIDDESKEFLHELSEFCTYIKIHFNEWDDEYRIAEMMKEMISKMLSGKPFETHK